MSKIRSLSRTRPAKWVCFAVVLLVVSGCAGSNSSATAAPTLTSAPIIATPLPDVKSFPLDDDHSIIHFHATLTLGNLAVNGTFNVKGKQLAISTHESQTHVAIDLQIDGNSVTSPGNIGVGILKSMLETTTFPYANLIAAADLPTVDLGATPTAANAVGTLYLHGKTLPVQMPVTLAIRSGQIFATGQISLDLTDYAMVVPSLINSKMTLNADLVTQLTAGPATAAATP